jgi:hypothetical protein
MFPTLPAGLLGLVLLMVPAWQPWRRVIALASFPCDLNREDGKRLQSLMTIK